MEEDTTVEYLAELAMTENIAQLPASAKRLEVFRKAQSEDPTCAILLQYCRNGWPGKHSINPTVKPYWEAQGQLTIGDGILLFGSRIVVPKALQGKSCQSYMRDTRTVSIADFELTCQYGGMACPNRSAASSRPALNVAATSTQTRSR